MMEFGGFFNKALKAGNMVFGDGISRQVQHDYRLVEMAQESQYQKVQLELRDNQSRELQIIMHELRIDFERSRRRMENSPFFHDDLDTADLLWQAFKEKGKPLFLVSPFWDETKTNVIADAGGGESHFRTAISGAWHEFQYDKHGVCLDGIFKRPLRQTDIDVRWIRNALKDLPIVLAYGYNDGKLVYPVIATWNILPSTTPNEISTFHGRALLPNDGDNEEFRRYIGQAMTGIAGSVIGITEDGENFYFKTQARLLSIYKNRPEVSIEPSLISASLNQSSDKEQELPIDLSINPPASDFKLESKQTSSNKTREQSMANQITTIVGFDFGDAETALAKIGINATPEQRGKSSPEAISTVFSPKLSGGVITTAVGYKTSGEILIGLAAESADDLRKGGLHVSFKKKPVQGDHAYTQLVADYINVLFEHLYNKDYIIPLNTKVIIGHPSKWKKEAGNPVEILKDIFSKTKIAEAAAYEVVAESRGAMVDAIENNVFTRETVGSGWVLVIDLGSSTCDFTVVNMNQKSSKPIDFGEELGARLIDRAIQEAIIENSENRSELELLFANYPEEKVRFQLKCRACKEKFFSGYTAVIEPYKIYKLTDDGRKNSIYIDIELTQELMNSILEHRPVFNMAGRNISWKYGFKNVLEETKNALIAEGVSDIKAILLTGGASHMGFIDEICSDVFPAIDIKRSGSPSFTIANGLARWGRIEIQTDQFFNDIQEFCSKNIEPRVSSQIDLMYEKISITIADNIVKIIKSAFDSWRNKNYSTINSMKDHIDDDIREWMDKNLGNCISEQVRPILINIGKNLGDDIKGLELKYGIPIGFLGSSFSMSTVKAKHISVSLGGMDFTDGMADGLGSVVGVIAGLITGVVIYIVTPIILGIIIKIVAIISITLASLIFSILISNPAGWVILAGIGIAAIAAGGEAKKKVEENMPSWDLPEWVRKLVNKSSIYSKIDEQRGEIIRQVTLKLKDDRNLRKQISDNTIEAFRKGLEEKAQDARMLII